jgi:hypothetical protein
MGEQLLHRLGVPFHELTKRQVVLLDQLVDISHRGHLAITSVVGIPTCSA